MGDSAALCNFALAPKGAVGTVNQESTVPTVVLEWLPVRNANRTNSARSAWELTPYYSRTCDNGRLFVRGEKPAELAHLARINGRQWRRYQNDCDREEPILKGMRFLHVFEDESVSTYAEAAEILGVSRQRVCQLVSLVAKLPDEVNEFLVASEDPAIGRYFTERRLRPLTKLGRDEDKLAQFTVMLEEARRLHPT